MFEMRSNGPCGIVGRDNIISSMKLISKRCEIELDEYNNILIPEDGIYHISAISNIEVIGHEEVKQSELSLCFGPDYRTTLLDRDDGCKEGRKICNFKVEGFLELDAGRKLSFILFNNANRGAFVIDTKIKIVKFK